MADEKGENMKTVQNSRLSKWFQQSNWYMILDSVPKPFINESGFYHHLRTIAPDFGLSRFSVKDSDVGFTLSLSHTLVYGEFISNCNLFNVWDQINHFIAFTGTHKSSTQQKLISNI